MEFICLWLQNNTSCFTITFIEYMEYMFINLWSVYIEWCILYMHQMWLNQDNFGVFGNHNEEFIIKLNVYESMLKFQFILKAPDQGVMFNDSVKVIDCTSDSAVQN